VSEQRPPELTGWRWQIDPTAQFELRFPDGGACRITGADMLATLAAAESVMAAVPVAQASIAVVAAIAQGDPPEAIAAALGRLLVVLAPSTLEGTGGAAIGSGDAQAPLHRPPGDSV
jgi:hypothetical protein